MTFGRFILFTLTLLPYLRSQDSLRRVAREELLALKKNFLTANEELYQHIFSDYNANLPPIYTGIRNVTISNELRSKILLTLLYARLVEVSARKQLMTIILEYTMTWEDERLIWDPNEFNGIDHIYVLRKNMWIPGISLVDSMETLETQPEYKQHVYINNHGQATFYNSLVISVGCALDVTNFPFDYQNCSVSLIARTIYSHEIMLRTAISENLDISIVGNDEWEITNILTCRHLYKSTEDNSAVIDNFVFYMKRNATYYVMLIVLPSFMLTLLCVAGLFSSSLLMDELKKVTIGLSTMVSTAVTISIVADNIPKAKHFPKLGLYVFNNLATVSLATLLVIVLPKIIRLIYWTCRRRPLNCVRGRSDISFALNVVLLVIFEGCVLSRFISVGSGVPIDGAKQALQDSLQFAPALALPDLYQTRFVKHQYILDLGIQLAWSCYFRKLN